VKTFLSEFANQNRDENFVPTQISGLLINPVLEDFT